MAGKFLDWNKVATVNFDDIRREKQGLLTGRQLFAKAYADKDRQEASAELSKSLEPLLKAKLVEYLANRQPIKVLAAFGNATETLGGVQKSENTDEDDFYYNGSKNQDPSTSTASASFQEIIETIPAGIELMFKSLDKQLGQFVFKGSDGHDYAIYTHPEIMFQGKTIKNTGYYGLLFNTQIRNEIA